MHRSGWAAAWRNRGGGWDKWGRSRRRRVFILVVARQVMRHPHHPQYTHPSFLTDTYIMLLHDGSTHPENVTPVKILSSVSEASDGPRWAFFLLVVDIWYVSTPKPSLFRSIYEAVLLYLLPLVWLLRVSIDAACTTVLWLHIYSDSSPHTHCTLSVSTETNQCLLYVCECDCAGVQLWWRKRIRQI